ncbi:MAG TPA: hypothetical protein EYP36_05885, partial [Calditrichaeota bacterium]|nr:hypothetical protein [Calditrichota bacterium]
MVVVHTCFLIMCRYVRVLWSVSNYVQQLCINSRSERFMKIQKKYIKTFPLLIIVILFSLIHCQRGNRLILVDKGETDYLVYHGPQEGIVIQRAARELAEYLEKISGAEFPVTTENNKSNKLIVIGRNNPFTAAVEKQMNIKAITNDGFRILTYKNNIYIAGAVNRGTLYGVYHFLDIYFNVRWFSPEFEIVPSQVTLTVPQINDLQNPRFAYREIFSGDTDDGYFRHHNRLNGSRGQTHRDNELIYTPENDIWSKDGPAGGHNFHDIISESYHHGGQILAMSDGVRSQAASHFVSKISAEGDEHWYAFSQEDRGWDPDPASQSFADAHGGTLS